MFSKNLMEIVFIFYQHNSTVGTYVIDSLFQNLLLFLWKSLILIIFPIIPLESAFFCTILFYQGFRGGFYEEENSNEL